MRALSDLELFGLAKLVLCPNFIADRDDDAHEKAWNACVARGLATHHVAYDDPDFPGEDVDVWEVTDLGRLAFRVSRRDTVVF